MTWKVFVAPFDRFRMASHKNLQQKAGLYWPKATGFHFQIYKKHLLHRIGL
ncbi:hypothetical protein ACFOG5_18390 [Pedobacter fastidiosus]|uniref:hypothetical protein n=1 Tax=Pedobacter fastidiosus TaxID=2765361 RepID=UPI0036081D4F